MVILYWSSRVLIESIVAFCSFATQILGIGIFRGPEPRLRISTRGHILACWDDPWTNQLIKIGEEIYMVFYLFGDSLSSLHVYMIVCVYFIHIGIGYIIWTIYIYIYIVIYIYIHYVGILFLGSSQWVCWFKGILTWTAFWRGSACWISGKSHIFNILQTHILGIVGYVSHRFPGLNPPWFRGKTVASFPSVSVASQVSKLARSKYLPDFPLLCLISGGYFPTCMCICFCNSILYNWGTLQCTSYLFLTQIESGR